MVDANDIQKTIRRVMKGVDARLGELSDTFTATTNFADLPREKFLEVDLVSEAGLRIRVATLERVKNGSVHVGVINVEGAPIMPPIMAQLSEDHKGKVVYTFLMRPDVD
ncbi:MAG TPA: hypothetical protein VFZ48_04125 [Candidatus Saccharimonadales bacterium]